MTSDKPQQPADYFTNTDNIIQPFQLEKSNLRGRLVRLGSVLDTILEAHNYPDAVNQLVGETLLLSSLLSAMLKYEGVFTLQAQGDGPIRMLVGDMTTQNHMRGCASFDEERLEKALEQLSALNVDERSQNQLAQLLGKGYMAFTVDQGEHMERYQGIVELKGASLVDCVQHYFTQSEQIKTGIKMAVGKRDGRWRASGMLVQQMPEEHEEQENLIDHNNRVHLKQENWPSHLDEDDWRRTMVLMDSCTRNEFLDPDLGENELLFRLFHEEGVRVYPAESITHQCRCTSDKVERVLYSLSEDDILHIRKDGTITLSCEFCSKDYAFDAAPILQHIRSNIPTQAPPEDTHESL